MKLRVLGCHGGETPTLRATSFLVDQHIVLDCGSLTRAISLEEQRALEHIVISHTHLDHVRDLGLLIDNTFAARQSPYKVYCTPKTADGLRRHYFNNVIWPDFLNIPNPVDPQQRPMLQLIEVEPGESVPMGQYLLKTVLVDHQIETIASIVQSPDGHALAYCGDTGPTQELWSVLNAQAGLRAIIAEVSFPDSMQDLALVSGHLTPSMLQEELRMFEPQQSDCQIFVYGLKPAFYDQLLEQVERLHIPNLRILHPMHTFDLSEHAVSLVSAQAS